MTQSPPFPTQDEAVSSPQAAGEVTTLQTKQERTSELFSSITDTQA